MTSAVMSRMITETIGVEKSQGEERTVPLVTSTATQQTTETQEESTTPHETSATVSTTTEKHVEKDTTSTVTSIELRTTDTDCCNNWR